MTIDADGVPNKWGKVFNQTYPGPWIRKSLLSASLLSMADLSFL